MKKANPIGYAAGRIWEFVSAVFSGHVRRALAIAGRYVLLLPMAVCAAAIISSDDANARMIALLALLAIMQIREWWLVREIISPAGRK